MEIGERGEGLVERGGGGAVAGLDVVVVLLPDGEGVPGDC